MKSNNLIDVGFISFLLLFFIPGFREINAIRIFSSVLFVIVGISSTIVVIIATIGLIFLFLFAFTDKMDTSKMVSTSIETKKHEKIISTVKIIVLIFLTANFNLNYLAALYSILLIYTVAIYIVVPHVRTKSALLVLSGDNNA